MRDRSAWVRRRSISYRSVLPACRTRQRSPDIRGRPLSARRSAPAEGYAGEVLKCPIDGLTRTHPNTCCLRNRPPTPPPDRHGNVGLPPLQGSLRPAVTSRSQPEDPANHQASGSRTNTRGRESRGMHRRSRHVESRPIRNRAATPEHQKQDSCLDRSHQGVDEERARVGERLVTFL